MTWTEIQTLASNLLHFPEPDRPCEPDPRGFELTFGHFAIIDLRSCCSLCRNPATWQDRYSHPTHPPKQYCVDHVPRIGVVPARFDPIDQLSQPEQP